MNSAFLLDNWEKTGIDLEELKEEIKQMQTATHFRVVDSSLISLTSLLDKETVNLLNLDEDEDYLFRSNSKPGPLEILLSISSYGKMSKKSKEDISLLIPNEETKSDVLYKEFKHVKTLMDIDGERFFLSNSFFKNIEGGTLGGVFTKPSIYRDAALVHSFKSGKEVTICYKEYEGAKKAFAFLSKKYAPISQTVIFDILPFFEKELGRMDVKGWRMTHFSTELTVEFPEYAEEISKMYGKVGTYIPGLIISTSDTGDCSLRIKGTLRKGKSIFLFKEVSRKHIGKFNLEKTIDKVKKNIFEQFTLIPEKMMELMSVDISPDDLSTKEKQTENIKIVKDYFDILMKETDIVSVLGRKGKIKIKETLYRNINPATSYTLYDVVDLFMMIPESVINLPKYATDKLRQLVATAPFVDFTKADSVEVMM